jgi:hypothetical protein
MFCHMLIFFFLLQSRLSDVRHGEQGMPAAGGSLSSRPEEENCKKVKVVYARGWKPA